MMKILLQPKMELQEQDLYLSLNQRENEQNIWNYII